MRPRGMIVTLLKGNEQNPAYRLCFPTHKLIAVPKPAMRDCPETQDQKTKRYRRQLDQ